jgi:hypothetical protein
MIDFLDLLGRPCSTPPRLIPAAKAGFFRQHHSGHLAGGGHAQAQQSTE